jgi:putative tricarboxylic transport membrane protein
MAEHLLLGFELFFQWKVLVSMVSGALTGMLIGALPGMTVVMAISLALPFTFYMEPVVAISFLLGIYKAGVYGGSISAVLIGTPGTPASAATIIDGYAMTRKGLAKKALSMSLYASVISDFISDIITVVAAIQIAHLALMIGPVEFFAIIVFSLTIIAGVSGDSLVKGLISGAFGLLLATVGMDSLYGVTRFTFGDIDLTGGFNIIPVLIGLFAIPEMIKQLKERKLHPEKTTIIDTDILVDTEENRITWTEFKGVFRTILRGSLIGSVIGIIPGVGAAPAAFINYGRSKKLSKHPEEYGKGSLEAVAAAESGNNGVCGPTLIPLLTLGIPGDKTTAVLLGAFVIQGLTPGPLLFQKHIDIVYGIFIAMLLINVLVLGIGKIAVKWAALISHVPKEIMFSVVFILCVFGCYASSNLLFDVWVMIFVGGFGYLMLIFGLPQAPFVIAFILSPLFENGLRRSLIMSGGDLSVFVKQPIALAFILLTVVTIVFIAWGKRNKGKLSLKK